MTSPPWHFPSHLEIWAPSCVAFALSLGLLWAIRARASLVVLAIVGLNWTFFTTALNQYPRVDPPTKYNHYTSNGKTSKLYKTDGSVIEYDGPIIRYDGYPTEHLFHPRMIRPPRHIPSHMEIWVPPCVALALSLALVWVLRRGGWPRRAGPVREPMFTTRTSAVVLVIVAINLAFVTAALKKYPRLGPAYVELNYYLGDGKTSTLYRADGSIIEYDGYPLDNNLSHPRMIRPPWHDPSHLEIWAPSCVSLALSLALFWGLRWRTRGAKRVLGAGEWGSPGGPAGQD